MRWVPETRDGDEMRGWGRKVPPAPHAAGEMGQALEAVPRLREPVGRAAELRWGLGWAASHLNQLEVWDTCCV